MCMFKVGEMAALEGEHGNSTLTAPIIWELNQTPCSCGVCVQTFELVPDILCLQTSLACAS